MTDFNVVRLLGALSRAAAAIGVLIGGLVLVGWFFDIAVLNSIGPGLVTMKANTALAFVLAGAALWLLHVQPAGPRVRRLAVACAAVTALIGLLTLGEYLFGWNLHIDQVLVHEASGSVGTSPPGRMAPTTALNFLLLGLALLFLHAGVAFRGAQSLSLGAGLVALVTLIGYLYDAKTLYRIASHTEMALHTALAFVILSAGALFARPERGLTAILTSDGVGGAAARRLLPIVLVVPIALGWARLRGERAGLYETEFGLTLVIAAAVVVLLASIWTYATSLDRAATARELAEEALRRNEARFRELIEGAPDAMVIADAEGQIVLVNAQTERMFGYARAELLGHPVETLLPERLRSVHVGHRVDYHAAPRTRPMGGGLDLLARRKDGSELLVEVSLSPLVNDGETLVTSVIRDVTERKRADAEIRRRQREAEELARVGRAVSQSLSPSVATRQIADGLRRLLPVPMAIVCGLDPQSEDMVLLAVAGDDTGAFTTGLVVPWNAGATGVALRESQVVSSPDILADPRILVPPDVRARLEPTPYRAVLAVPLILRGTAIGALTACDRAGRLFDTEEIRLAQAFADHATVALENARLYAEMEQRVTERTADLEAANKELEAFAYSVSHDLRAPLRAMDGFSRMLVEKHAPQLSDETRRYLGVVRKSSQEMGQLIEDLLTFSRLGRQPVERRTVSLSRLAGEAFDDLVAEHEGRRVELVVGDLPECKADPRLLKHVFVNLLSNALKFTRAREVARIEVGGCLDGGEHACFVRDNGVGFDMRYVDKLFGVFQRLHRAEDYEGTGVGLAIVERIVHRHGGRVWAEAKVDQGATVYFTLRGGPTHA